MIVSLALAASAAWAGSYAGANPVPGSNPVAYTPYSGGTYTVPGPNGMPSSFPYTLGNTQNLASGYGGDSGGQSASCTGTITTSYQWVPAAGQTTATDPPPSQVIVMQSSSVEVTVVSPAAQGTYDTGLGKSGSVAWSPGGSNTVSVTSVQYSVQAGGASVTLTVAPRSVAAAPGDTASVRYTATVSPVTINLTGGIGLSTAKHLLIGQQLVATLSSGPLIQTSWGWGASGGEPFKNYVANISSATYTALGYETGSQLICYFSEPSSSASVSCTVHLAVPAGSSPAGGLDVTATQSLTVEKPGAILDVSCGSVTDLPTATNPTGVQLQQIYTYPESGYAEGISWSGTITTPAAYVTSGNYGSWNWTQLITAQRQQKNNGIYWQFAVNTTTPATIINGMSVLDGTYPYGPFWYPSNGVATGNADSPYQPLDASSAIREYDVSDSFNDYLMYLPPGSGSLPVPLKRSGWYWDFQALKDVSNNWSTSGMNAQWGFISDFPAFPTWTFCAAIGHLVYVAPPAQK